jgi:hypothetical protein
MAEPEVKWTEISHVIDGIEYDLSSFNEGNDNERELAFEFVEQIKFEAKIAAGPEELWEIYIYPHSCAMDDQEECICRQYDLVHKPEWTNEKVEVQHANDDR